MIIAECGTIIAKQSRDTYTIQYDDHVINIKLKKVANPGFQPLINTTQR